MRKLYFTLSILISSYSFLFSQQPGSSDSTFNIQDSVLIPTRSGIPISAIIVQKKGNSVPLPVILFYTTYYQGPGDAIFAKKSADRGYVGIIAYARGIRTDLRQYQPYEHEGTDIYDIIDWISRQSWCDGKVGMYGGSYTGFSQWATVKNIHPALKTIVPQVAVMPGFDVPMENNVQLNMGLYWPNDNIYKRPPIRRSLPFEWFENGNSFASMDSLAGFTDTIFHKWLKHPAYDDYWQSMVPTPAEYAAIRIPVLTTTGYYDGSQLSAMKYFNLHNQFNKQAEHYLVIGPYDHWGAQRKPAPELMGYKIDSVANTSMIELAYEWLDYILKGADRPALLKDKINYEVMGSNEWKHKPALKDINNDTLTFYLHQKTLSSSRPRKPTFERQSIDFKDRQSQNNFFTPTIILDSLDASGGLIFSTPALKQAVDINGSFTGNLVATINKKDMDISLALFELTADGKYFFLARYLGRASYARDNTVRKLLSPNKKMSIPFNNTRFVSKKIDAGSRLVILLNINKHPFEIINYGSGKEVSDETIHDAGDPLVIKWYSESSISIPVWKH